MKIPCFEHNVTEKDPFFDEKAEKAFWNGNRLGISPAVAKAFYKQAKQHRDNGLEFPEIIAQMHKDSGLRSETIAKILAANKSANKLSNDMWHQQARYREIKTAAEIMVEQANTPEWWKRADQAWNLSRSAATAFHGGVIPFSHARALAMGTPVRVNLREGKVTLDPREQKIWAGMVKRAYSYATPNTGRARWMRDMSNMVVTDRYKEAVRYGVKAKPSDRPTGLLSNIARGWGIRGFDALKPGRVDLFHLWKDQLKEYDDGSLRMLADEVNHATGDLELPGKVSRVLPYFSFAPKLWIAKRLEAFSPIRYFSKLGKMTPAERMVGNLTLKRWARHMIAYTSILAANDAFNKMIGSKNRVNWHDFSSPGTLWRVNLGGHIIPFSPLVEVIRTPVAALAAMMMTRRQLHGEAPIAAAGELIWRDVVNALHPSIIKGVELISGREVFGVPRHQRRLPSVPIPGTSRRFPGVAQVVRGEEPERDAPVGWAEYLLEQGPIPAAGAAREVFSPALQEEGIPKPAADKWIEALVNSALSGLAGMHSFEVSPKSAPQHTRYKRTPGTIKQ